MTELPEPFVTRDQAPPMRVREPEAIIAEVEPGSIADQLGLAPGDKLRRINGQPPRDVIDYDLWCGVEELELLIEHPDGELEAIELEKDEHEDLGLGFEDLLFVPLRTCNNGCLFCFVVQAPPGMRPTVYLKDDDYRLSFLGGHFTTLTNLTEPHYERILAQHLSPMYVSVHASEPELRRVLLDNLKADAGWRYLSRLVADGIECHTQIVLCPGVNDGAHLDRTIGDLLALGPGVLSLGVVPVGLTRYQAHPLMRPMTAGEAAATIAQLDRWREQAGTPGDRRVYAADELYLFAGLPQPTTDYYDVFPQVENGIGQTRLFLDAAEELLGRLPAKLSPPRRAVLITGGYGEVLLAEFVAKLNGIVGLTVELRAIRNELFGGNVDCSGLLCGQDIAAQLPRQADETVLLLPGRALNELGLFLDDWDLPRLQVAVGGRPMPCLTPADVARAVGLAREAEASPTEGFEI